MDDIRTFCGVKLPWTPAEARDPYRELQASTTIYHVLPIPQLSDEYTSEAGQHLPVQNYTCAL